MIIIFFILAIASLIFIGLPFLAEQAWPQLESRPFTDIRRKKREGIWAISDIDSELEMGKLTTEDHAALRVRMKEELAGIIQRERDMADHDNESREQDIPLPLKKKLLFEVMRICGIQRS
jgi:hypothetical protein